MYVIGKLHIHQGADTMKKLLCIVLLLLCGIVYAKKMILTGIYKGEYVSLEFKDGYAIQSDAIAYPYEIKGDTLYLNVQGYGAAIRCTIIDNNTLDCPLLFGILKKE